MFWEYFSWPHKETFLSKTHHSLGALRRRSLIFVVHLSARSLMKNGYSLRYSEESAFVHENNLLNVVFDCKWFLKKFGTPTIEHRLQKSRKKISSWLSEIYFCILPCATTLCPASQMHVLAHTKSIRAVHPFLSDFSSSLDEVSSRGIGRWALLFSKNWNLNSDDYPKLLSLKIELAPSYTP